MAPRRALLAAAAALAVVAAAVGAMPARASSIPSLLQLALVRAR